MNNSLRISKTFFIWKWECFFHSLFSHQIRIIIHIVIFIISSKYYPLLLIYLTSTSTLSYGKLKIKLNDFPLLILIFFKFWLSFLNWKFIYNLVKIDNYRRNTSEITILNTFTLWCLNIISFTRFRQLRY